MFSLFLSLIIFFPRPPCPPLTSEDIHQMLELRTQFLRPSSTTPSWLHSEAMLDRVVIGYQPEALTPLISRIEGLGAQPVMIDTTAHFMVITLDSYRFRPVQQALIQFNGVRFVEPDYPARILNIPNDPQFLLRQWDKWVMYADLAWDVVTGGPIKVAVVDNGVEYTHPDLEANFRFDELGFDLINNDPDPQPDNPRIENAFHGTHVAGIIAGVSNNMQGIAGWAQIQLLAVRVLNDSGNGALSDVARGIRWAVDHGARVINLSLGGDAPSSALIEACQYAASNNVLLVAASGNDGRPAITYPARLNECVAVGATNENSGLASFSNYGPEQELVAPGTSIYSTTLGGVYAEASGTSMATPQVSGVAALLFALNPALSATDVRAILIVGAIDMGTPGRDQQFGYGLVNAWRSVQLAQTLHRQNLGATSALNPAPNRLVSGLELDLGTYAPVRIYNSIGTLIFSSATPIRRVLLPSAGTYVIEFNRQQRHKVMVLR